MYQVQLSSNFIKASEKLTQKNKKLLECLSKTLMLLQTDIDHPSLRLHKLSGSNNYSASVNMSIRIILNINENVIFLVKIGKHEDVY